MKHSCLFWTGQPSVAVFVPEWGRLCCLSNKVYEDVIRANDVFKADGKIVTHYQKSCIGLINGQWETPPLKEVVCSFHELEYRIRHLLRKWCLLASKCSTSLVTLAGTVSHLNLPHSLCYWWLKFLNTEQTHFIQHNLHLSRFGNLLVTVALLLLFDSFDVRNVLLSSCVTVSAVGGVGCEACDWNCHSNAFSFYSGL